MNRFVLTDVLPEKIILTDDPLRVKMIVAHYLDNIEILYEQRGMIGCSGVFRDVKIAALSCGFGETAVRLYLNEAVCSGAKKIIYLGECVSLKREMGLMSVIVAEGGDKKLSDRIITKADAMNVRVSVVKTMTDDNYWYKEAAVQNDKGSYIIDFATNAVYTESKKYGVTAAAVLTVSENTVTAQRVTANTRQSRFNDAALLALEAFSDCD